MSEVKIVYGTGSGNTKMVCQRVTEVLEEKGHTVTMFPVKITEPEGIGTFDLLIWAAPTLGHGEMEGYMDAFMKKSQKLDLTGKKCAVIGLGDFKYDMEYFLEAEKDLTKFLTEKKADILCQPLKIAKCPLQFLNTLVLKWAEGVHEQLTTT